MSATLVYSGENYKQDLSKFAKVASSLMDKGRDLRAKFGKTFLTEVAKYEAREIAEYRSLLQTE